MNYKNKDAKVVDDFNINDEIIMPKYIKVGTENTRENYKKALSDDSIPHLKINEEALKTIVDEMKKNL